MLMTVMMGSNLFDMIVKACFQEGKVTHSISHFIPVKKPLTYWKSLPSKVEINFTRVLHSCTAKSLISCLYKVALTLVQSDFFLVL